MNAYGVVPNPCLIASALAPMTRRVALCILGNPLPLLNPLRVAEEYAMVDVLSGGRLVAGFPRGVPQNFASYGIDPADSKGRLAEAIDLVLKAWTYQGPFDWADEYYRFSQVSIWPQPTAVPDIVLSCRSPESVALAVRHRAVMAEIYVKDRHVLEHFTQSRSAYQGAAEAAGWEAAPDRFLVSVPCVIAPTDAEAQERAHRAAVYAREYISGSFEQGKLAVRDAYDGGAHARRRPRPRASRIASPTAGSSAVTPPPRSNRSSPSRRRRPPASWGCRCSGEISRARRSPRACGCSEITYARGCR